MEVPKRQPSRGPNLIPLKKYLAAQELHGQGKDDEALLVLSEAMGSKEPLVRLKGSLAKIFDRTTALSDIALHLTLVESKRRMV